MTSGWGRDKNRQRLARQLEFANTSLAESRELIRELFQRGEGRDLLDDKAAQIQVQIAELKRLVKQ